MESSLVFRLEIPNTKPQCRDFISDSKLEDLQNNQCFFEKVQKSLQACPQMKQNIAKELLDVVSMFTDDSENYKLPSVRTFCNILAELKDTIAESFCFDPLCHKNREKLVCVVRGICCHMESFENILAGFEKEEPMELSKLTQFSAPESEVKRWFVETTNKLKNLFGNIKKIIETSAIIEINFDQFLEDENLLIWEDLDEIKEFSEKLLTFLDKLIKKQKGLTSNFESGYQSGNAGSLRRDQMDLKLVERMVRNRSRTFYTPATFDHLASTEINKNLKTSGLTTTSNDAGKEDDGTELRYQMEKLKKLEIHLQKLQNTSEGPTICQINLSNMLKFDKKFNILWFVLKINSNSSQAIAYVQDEIEMKIGGLET